MDLALALLIKLWTGFCTAGAVIIVWEHFRRKESD